MGLDSVELIIELEIFFNVEISDKAAGEIGTIQEATDHISTIVKYFDRGIDSKAEILKRLIEILSDLQTNPKPVSADQRIFDLLPINNQDGWKILSEKLNYELPVPYLTGRFGKFVERIFPSKVKFEDTTLDRFVDLLIAVNYKTVLKKGQIQNRHEVLIGVIGITIDKCGVNPFEVFPNSRFTSDLGID